MNSNLLIGVGIVLQYTGWVLAVIFGLAYIKQRKEIMLLKEQIQILKSHEKKRDEKNRATDKMLLNIASILSDEKMSIQNKQKLDEVFNELNKK